MAFDSIPAEMRSYRQWICWRYEKGNEKPLKLPYNPITGSLASVIKESDWCSFDEAVAHAHNYSGIGFVLTENDPYAFIDLDHTAGNSNLLSKQLSIYNDFDSYSERSPGGFGLHIIVKGFVPSGKRKDSIEVYSDSRYMTMTGDVFRNAPINYHHEQLNALWESLGGNHIAKEVWHTGIEEPTESNDVIYERACNAENGDKFLDLFNGKWQEYYPSHSEADLSLINIIAYYTQSKKQILEIFRASKLANRKKSHRKDYIEGLIQKSFDKMLPPIDLYHIDQQMKKSLAAVEKNGQPVSLGYDTPTPPTPLHPYTPDTPTPCTPLHSPLAHPYTLPPGLVGDIAKFIHAQAPRPVPEIALAGALGLMSGIIGRSYNISGTGLNQYVLLLAATGNGKEAIASGVDKLMGEVIKLVPSAVDFVGPSEIASSQAVVRYMSSGKPSFVSMVGEFGLYMQQMCGPSAGPHMIGLRKFLLDAYNKSGEGKIMRPSIYSDAAKNTLAVRSPAFSLLGESTPERFYEGLHEGLISEGLLPRFTVIEYSGQRPPLNRDHGTTRPPQEVIGNLAAICGHSLNLNSQNRSIDVELDDAADKIMHDFDKFCDEQVNKSDREVRRHLWNRGHIKALKMAGLLAVGCNPYNPTVTLEHAQWAINLVISDIQNMLTRFEAGEIGDLNNDENKQVAKLTEAVRDYFIKSWDTVKAYAMDDNKKLYSASIIPHGYFQRKLIPISCFKKDRMGASFALKRAIKILIDRGDIAECPRHQISATYGTRQVCYVVTSREAVGLPSV